MDTPEHTDQHAPDESTERVDDGLLSRLRVIEDQPLESRADAYTHVYDELRSRLEGSDAPRRHA